MIKLPVFKEKRCSYLYNNFVYWDCAASQIPQLYLKKKKTFLPTARFAWILSNMQKETDPDILINVLKDCIVFPLWAA